MKSIIKFIKGLLCLAILTIPIIIHHECSAISPSFGALKTGVLPEPYNSNFPQNNITGWNPCEGGVKSSGLCGDTAEEKMWSLLLQHFDALHAAAAMGSIAHEGGSQPVKWEYGNVVNTSTCQFVVSWDDLWNGVYDGRYGVGSFGLTSGLSEYLHYVGETAPDLLKYFQDPSLTCYSTGDALAEAIGEDEYDRLMELEVNYFIEKWLGQGKPKEFETFKTINNLEEAAIFWAHSIEVCAACGYDGGSSQLPIRAAAAAGYYDLYKDFVCTASSSSSSNSSSSSGSSGSSTNSSSSSLTRRSPDITLIGDSISVYAASQLKEKFPTSFLNMVGARHVTKDGDCSDKGKGGLGALQQIISGSETVNQQVRTKSSSKCEKLPVTNNSLKDNVVWQLGTNTAGATKENIEKIIKKIGYRKLFLVTPYSPVNESYAPNLKSDLEKIAQMYRDVANEHDNVYVVDWANAVKGDWKKYILEEGTTKKTHINPTNTGKELLASLISDAVKMANEGSKIISTPSNAGSDNSGKSVTGDQITWIGDSYSVFVDNKGLINSKFSGADIGPSPNNTSSSYIQGSKFVSSGSGDNPSCLSILENIINAGKLRPYLVFACGTNGGWSDSDVAKFQELIKDKDVKAVVVNSRFKACYPGISCDPTFADSNSRLKAMADSNDKIVLADWVSAYDEKYFGQDPVHPYDDPGGEKWIEVIADALGDSGDNCDGGGGDSNVVKAAEEIIELANKNGSTYGGGHGVENSVFDGMLNNGDPIKVDCTGFVNLVMYKAFGQNPDIATSSINKSELFEEVQRKDVQPGDAFAYDPQWGYTGAAHGGIVAEVEDGKITKVAEVGGQGGRSGDKNRNIGITTIDDNYNGTISILNSSDGHFFRWKGAASSSDSSDDCPTVCNNGDDDSGLQPGGITSVEDARKTVIEPYKDISGENICNAGLGFACNAYTILQNCVSFSRWFIANFTTIEGVASLDGEGIQLADNFYNGFHDKYPNLKISTSPSAYSVASCAPNHTFIVLGIISESEMLIGEAGWGEPLSFIDAKTMSTDGGGYYNCKYVGFEDYMKGL